MFLYTCALWSLAHAADEPAPSEPTPADPDDVVDDLIVVSGVRADTTTPATRAELGRDDLDALSHGQEMPYVLATTPSIQAWGDTGVGAGYSYLSLRGLAQNRLDITLNGVPLADSEDMGVYFSNYVDFASNVESVQIQRGVGTSAGGTPSYGGAIHFESRALSATPASDLSVAVGSFGAKKLSASVQTGELGGGWRAYARASAFDTDGWRDNTAVSQQSTFVSVGRFTDNDSLRIVGMLGRTEQQLAYYAVTPADLAASPTVNYLSPDERDEFGQELAQIQYARDVGDDDEIAISAYTNTARGWYDVRAALGDPTSPILRYRLDNQMVGLFGHYDAHAGDVTISPGFHVSGFQRRHRMAEAGVDQYTNRGQKGDASVFMKIKGDFGAVHPYLDVQARLAGFRYDGAVPIEPATWGFLNPKAGLTWAPGDVASVYASIGGSGREPTRTDMFSGQDEPSVSYDLYAVKPEHVVDVELGGDLRTAIGALHGNVYAMEFKDEQALTGEVTAIGAYLRSNVDRSFRRGVEVDAHLLPTDRLDVRVAGALEWARIAEWTQFYDVYDADFAWLGSASAVYEDVPILLTPWGIGQINVAVTPVDALRIGLGARAVSPQYLDNTGDDAFVSPGYVLVDGDLGVTVPRTAERPAITATLRVDNALDQRRVYPSGYSYRYVVGEDPTIGGDSYYFPQAPRSALLTVTIGM